MFKMCLKLHVLGLGGYSLKRDDSETLSCKLRNKEFLLVLGKLKLT